MKTNQEVFDIVSNHLLTQKTKATVTYEKGIHTNTACVYRTADGLKCAVGCLIPDGVDLDGMLTLPIRSAFRTCPVLFNGLGIDGGHLELLVKLQRVHDATLVCEWPLMLKEVANTFELELPEALKAVLANPTAWLETV